jgi:predicted 3-demethylubiquinone-9 3-methyltransferase (glyoxalase superfamily)
MQKIVPHLWFDKEAKDASEFYVSVFSRNSQIKDMTTIHGTPSGDAQTVTFELYGHEFMAISAGPYFKLNPTVSFMVSCPTVDEVDELWSKLIKGNTRVMIELGAYPYSKRYGWLVDKYGLSWQLIAVDGPIEQRITPTIMYVGAVAGKCEEAIRFYTSVFHNSRIGDLFRYAKGQEPDREGTIAHGPFVLEGQEFVAMDSAKPHQFTFNEAISFIVNCNSQAEIDYYWGKLSAVPEAEQCGWLKDKYGLSWQVVPTIMGEMMRTRDTAKLARVTEAFLKMKKFDIAALERAAEGK